MTDQEAQVEPLGWSPPAALLPAVWTVMILLALALGGCRRSDPQQLALARESLTLCEMIRDLACRRNCIDPGICADLESSIASTRKTIDRIEQEGR